MSEITDAHLTADLVVLAPNEHGEPEFLVVTRSEHSDAYPGWVALPGGYVDAGETFLHAAVREVEEEAGVSVSAKALRRIGIYDDPDRDPRGRAVSVAFLVELYAKPTAVAGDDADDVAWIPLEQRFDVELAFDHKRIVCDALAELSRSSTEVAA